MPVSLDRLFALFQSTLSMRRATYTPVYGDVAF